MPTTIAGSPYVSGRGYSCGSCGIWVDYSSPIGHVCSSITGSTYFPPVTPLPSAGIVYSLPMKHINWQEYIPARPPINDTSCLFVYLDNLNSKILTRGIFRINTMFEHEWIDENHLRINRPVTHYVIIELP